MYVVYINLLYFLSIFLFTYNKNLLSPPKKCTIFMCKGKGMGKGLVPVHATMSL